MLETAGDSCLFNFSVTDSGIGISEAAQAHLFRPFSQADSSITRKFGGTGLGLSICKRMVEAMGGKIGLDSREGSGSTFWFTLRLKKAEAAAAAKAENTAKAGFQGKRVLVVEDNTINQMVALRHLSKLGLQATAASNGREALELIARGSFDLILMDCQMPEMDGYEATQRIRRHEVESIRKLPVVAMTANAVISEKEKCVAAGMNDYLSKPFEPKALGEIVAKWISAEEPVKKPG